MKRQIQHHPFVLGYTDTAGVKPVDYCADCEMPRANQRHQLKPTTEAARQLDAAKLGETKEHQTT